MCVVCGEGLGKNDYDKDRGRTKLIKHPPPVAALQKLNILGAFNPASWSVENNKKNMETSRTSVLHDQLQNHLSAP